MYIFAKLMYKYTIMKTKIHRLSAIKRIVETEKISDQNELLKKLNKEGYQITQATLSRDLKFLRAGKIPDDSKGYIYKLLVEGKEMERDVKTDGFPLNGFVSLEFGSGLGVMKTLPGYASSLASAIDQTQPFEILGTVAGDDTILIVPRDGASRNDLSKTLTGLFPELQG
jgi:transcriptional regulator of arginine metabolism